MSFLLFEEATTAAAQTLSSAAKTGSLWGVNLGTTTGVSQHEKFVLLDLTETRAMNLSNVVPEGVDLVVMNLDPASFSSGDIDGKAWFLRGKLE